MFQKGSYYARKKILAPLGQISKERWLVKGGGGCFPYPLRGRKRKENSPAGKTRKKNKALKHIAPPLLALGSREEGRGDPVKIQGCFPSCKLPKKVSRVLGIRASDGVNWRTEGANCTPCFTTVSCKLGPRFPIMTRFKVWVGGGKIVRGKVSVGKHREIESVWRGAATASGHLLPTLPFSPRLILHSLLHALF